MTEKPRETQAESHVVELKEKVNNSSLMKHHEEEVNAWSFTTTRNTARGHKPLAPFGLRAAQAHLLCCSSSAMLWHGLRWFALHLHPWRPQRGPRDFYHGLLAARGESRG